MTDCPILFSAPMVRALLDGRKTQTRRILKPQPRLFTIDDKGTPCQVGVMQIEGEAVNSVWLGIAQAGVLPGQKVRFAAGDRLYVREAWKASAGNDRTRPTELSPETPVYFVADDRLWPVARYRAAMHMPRWASRLTLTVTDVRVERLQNISESDAKAEGLEFQMGWLPQYRGTDQLPWRSEFPRDAFHDLWDSINGKREGAGWDENPWVVAVSFTVKKGNIDDE